MLKSIFAGICIAFGAFASAGLEKPFNGIIFSIGLLMILFLGFYLFTGAILNLRRTADGSQITIRELILIYIGNFIGCYLMYQLILHSGYDLNNLIEIGKYKSNLTFMEAFLRAIPCNILVCIAVYLARKVVDNITKVFVIMLPVTLFVISGFEHSIANMFYYSFVGNYFNLIPVTLGNIIGGLLVILGTNK